jgi:hypothetical protein
MYVEKLEALKIFVEHTKETISKKSITQNLGIKENSFMSSKYFHVK